MNETTAGIVFGGLISLSITFLFHLIASRAAKRQAAEQEELLKAEIARLAELTNTLGRALHSAGWIDARFDADGRLIGVNHHVELRSEIALDCSMDGSVTRGPDTP